MYAIKPIGKSTGLCTQDTDDGSLGSGHCSWEHLIQEREDVGQVKHHKLIVMGNADTLGWTQKQTLPIVGGTERFLSARGTITVVLRMTSFSTRFTSTTRTKQTICFGVFDISSNKDGGMNSSRGDSMMEFCNSTLE